jgi:predicted N-acetyltransferase YhbS
MPKIVPLSRVAADDVETLLDAAFGADRKSRTAYKMRAGTRAIDLLSFAALANDGRLIGSLQSWPVALENEEGRKVPMTLVGPVAVSPDLQRGGIGRKLMERLMAAAFKHGHDALIMIGDPEYYGRFFGFTADATQNWSIPGPIERRRLLANITREAGIPAEGRVVPFP